jgi:hypothetical protein
MIGFKRVGIAALLIAPVMAIALPVQAAAPSIGVATTAQAAKTPAVTISGTKAVFTPVKITVTAKWNGTATCTAKLGSFTLANTTTVSQTVTNSGQVLVTLGSDEMTSVCIHKTAKTETLVFNLTSNKKAKLTVTVK